MTNLMPPFAVTNQLVSRMSSGTSRNMRSSKLQKMQHPIARKWMRSQRILDLFGPNTKNRCMKERQCIKGDLDIIIKRKQITNNNTITIHGTNMSKITTWHELATSNQIKLDQKITILGFRSCHIILSAPKGIGRIVKKIIEF